MTRIGIYNPHLAALGGGERLTAALATALHLDGGHDVTVVSDAPVELDVLGARFDMDLSGVAVADLGRHYDRRGRLGRRIGSAIDDHSRYRQLRKLQFDWFFNLSYQSDLPNPSPSGVYMCMFPQQLGRLPGEGCGNFVMRRTRRDLFRLLAHPRVGRFIDTYQSIIAISAFTAGYVRAFWSRDCEIVYPPCASMALHPPPRREHLILHVGRFFDDTAGLHHKKQDVLVESFSRMTDLHRAGWELHLAGGVSQDAGGEEFLRRLRSLAGAAPVHIHRDVSLAALKRLYNRASIYWHATGVGSAVPPEQQEHFGMSTVEAMSAGCTPVVIDSGGQREIVLHGVNGFRWKTTAELETFTRQIAGMTAEGAARLSEEAVRQAKKFGVAAFSQTVNNYVSAGQSTGA